MRQRRRAWAGVKDILAALKNVVGGEIEEYTKLMAEAREQAIDRMVGTAKARGANAVVNVRFTTSYIMTNASEILTYGEAMIVEPAADVSRPRACGSPAPARPVRRMCART